MGAPFHLHNCFRLAAIPIAVVFAPFVAVVLPTLVGFMAFVGPVARFAAVGAEMLYCLLITPLCVGHAAITIIPAIGLDGWRTAKDEKSAEHQSGYCGLAENGFKPRNCRFHKGLQERARAGVGMTY